MRILAIRGENLASLAGKFEVDFQQAPLADAGVFAISGPTGAGKSTILDALCLALYHDTPRLFAARENGVTIPDVANRTLSPQDPRNLLRRGCVEGHAEVDFIGRDGVPRRARWQVRRARGKKTGALQAASVSLTRIDTDTLETSALRETSDAIEKSVGLTFDQFRRAVLLAQNDFATLLKAAQQERADLLEALTNTGDFSLLSAAAYQRNAREQKQLEELKLKLNVLSVLSPEDRATLDDALGESQDECRQLSDALDGLRKEMQWHERGQRLAQDQTDAAQRCGQLHQALEASQAERHRLQQWNSIAPLLPQWDNRAETGTRIADLQAALPGLDAAIEATGTQQSTAEEAYQQSSHALEQATKRRHDADPMLIAAREADAAITRQRGLLEGHETQYRATVKEQGDVEASRARCSEEQQRLHGALDAWRDWRRAHPPLDQEDAHWNALGETLRNIGKGLDQLGQARTRSGELKQQQATAHAELDQTGQALGLAHAALLDAQSQYQGCDAAWQALDATALTAAKDAHQDHARCLAELAAALDAWNGVETRHDETSSKIVQLRQQITDQRQALGDMELAVSTADTAATEAHAAFDRANLAADQVTLRLREALRPGEPCLVCGSTEHPQAQAAPSPVDQLLAVLKHQQQAADTARDHARERRGRAKVELETTERALVETTAALEQIHSRSDGVRTQCTSIASQIGTGMADAVAQGRQALTTALGNAQEVSANRDQELAQRQKQVTSAAQARDAAGKAVEQRRSRWDEIRQIQDGIKEQLAPLDARHQATQLLIAQGEQALQAAMNTLRGQCGNPQLTLDQARGLRHDWNEGDIVHTAAAQAREPLATCNATLSAQSSRLTALSAQLRNLEQAREVATTGLQQARAHRQHVLAHPDADTYARELEKAEADARSTQEQHRGSLLAAKDAHEASRAACRNARKALEAAQEQFAHYGEQLLEQLQQRADNLRITAPDLDDLAGLIASLPDDLAGRTAEWHQREQAAAEADARRRALDGQRATWQAEAGSKRELGAARDALTSTEDLHNLALEKRAELQARQQEDVRRHIQAAEHRERIEVLAQQARRWQQLNDLIGSANGSKFKTYAQQFTLEVLLDYANQHLARLSPRYRLRRGNEPLSLLMIDTDFADEVRSVHSLSGGESFLVSLALALGLASLSSERVRVESLFIDEGFGSLDADTLNMAMEALDRLQSEGRRVGVISHVHDMAERIGVQIKVKPVAPGRSVVTVGE